MWYFWWGCRGNLKLFILGGERVSAPTFGLHELVQTEGKSLEQNLLQNDAVAVHIARRGFSAAVVEFRCGPEVLCDKNKNNNHRHQSDTCYRKVDKGVRPCKRSGARGVVGENSANPRLPRLCPLPPPSPPPPPPPPMSILRLHRRILDTIESYLLEFMTVFNQLDVDRRHGEPCLSHSTVRCSPKLLAESVGARCDTYGGIWRRLPCRARLWNRPWTPTARSPSLCTPSGYQSRS